MARRRNTGADMTRRGLGGMFVGAAGLSLGGCGGYGPYDVKVRITVFIDGPYGVGSGSSVVLIRAVQSRVQIGDVSPLSVGVKGEAPIVDLPSGKIFMTLARNGGIGVPTAVRYCLLMQKCMDPIDPGFFQGKSIDYWRKLSERWFGNYKVEVTPEYWMDFIRFRDINSANSIERLDPANLGVKRVVYETTSDPVTEGTIDPILPFVEGERRTTLRGDAYKAAFPPEVKFLKMGPRHDQ